MEPTYWLDLFTHRTWQEFLAAGASISGFRENRWKTVQAMKPGDILLCYLAGVSRWIGLLEVTGPAFQDTSPIWSVSDFPVRVPVKLTARLEPLTGVPVVEMRDVLSIFRHLKSPHAWTGRFRGSPSRWSREDGQVVAAAVREALAHPVERPFEPAKLSKVPPILKASKSGAVTIPEDDEPEAAPTVGISPPDAVGEQKAAAGERKEERAHTEVQWLLLKLGSDMGLDVWVARNDRGQSYDGQGFAALPRLKQDLPLQFDEATTRTIELIDVLWLRGNSIRAAFEIESTTSIFSGLLRMSDLITMQPNLNIRLYIVAPSERRDKVVKEVNRPTFARLSPPLSQVCQFISFEELRRQLELAKGFLQFLKPEFLDAISESCEPEDV
jgi:hypothetical protein